MRSTDFTDYHMPVSSVSIFSVFLVSFSLFFFCFRLLSKRTENIPYRIDMCIGVGDVRAQL